MNATLKFKKTQISFPVGTIQGTQMLLVGLKSNKINLDADSMVAKGTSERSALAWKHNL